MANSARRPLVAQVRGSWCSSRSRRNSEASAQITWWPSASRRAVSQPARNQRRTVSREMPSSRDRPDGRYSPRPNPARLPCGSRPAAGARCAVFRPTHPSRIRRRCQPKWWPGSWSPSQPGSPRTGSAASAPTSIGAGRCRSPPRRSFPALHRIPRHEIPWGHGIAIRQADWPLSHRAETRRPLGDQHGEDPILLRIRGAARGDGACDSVRRRRSRAGRGALLRA